MNKTKISNINGVNFFQIDPNFLEEGLVESYRLGFRHIDISSLNMQYANTFDIDFNCLKKFDHIDTLWFSSLLKISNKSDITPLYSLSSLKNLAFHQPSFDVDFSYLPNIETLAFTYNKNIKNVNKLKKVKELYITLFAEDNLLNLCGLTSLRSLRFDKGKFSSCEGIEHLVNLEKLRINYNDNIKNIFNVSLLPKLKFLHIEKCPKLVDYSSLANNESIEDIFISKLNSIAFVGQMKAIKIFRFWELENGDLNPLLSSTTLEQVEFYPEKKYYSHKKAELNQLLKTRS